MKSTTVILAAAAIFYMTGCMQPKAADLLKNDAQKKEVFAAILSNDSLSSELMDSLMMKHSDRVMMKMHSIMMGDKSMKEDMMDKMMDMCSTDSSMCSMMMSKMMDMCDVDQGNCKMMSDIMMSHKPVMKGMISKMNENGIMDKLCMDKCMMNMDMVK